MRFWKKNRARDTEFGGSIPTALQVFEVVVESDQSHVTRRPIHERFGSVLIFPRHPCFTVFYFVPITGVVFLNLMWLILRLIDTYKEVYPGSMLAANIELNSHTATAFCAFIWIFVFASTIFNWYIVGMWFLKLDNFCLTFILFYPLSALGALGFWLFFVIQIVWQGNVWSNACNDWDISAVVQGASYDCWPQCNQTAIVVGVATLQLLNKSNYTIQLRRTLDSPDIFQLTVNETHHISPPLSNITYNYSSSTFSIYNETDIFEMSPLSFPSLGLELKNPSIPFTRDSCYPPSAYLIRLNGSSVLKTATLNPDDCTKMRVCGTEDETGTFQIALGVIMIAQFKHAICC